MHKGIILLVKETDKEEALKKVREFLEGYRDNVWDWYQIGGRWHGEFAPMNKEFIEKAKSILPNNEDGFVSHDEIEIKQSELQKLWEDLGGLGDHLYCSNYKIGDDGTYYDVMPLSNCLSIVKEWQQTIQDAKKVLKDANKWLAKGGHKDREGNLVDSWDMYGYSLEKAGKLFQQEFCFDCNVYNIETYNYSIPSDIENYIAVMIDIHN